MRHILALAAICVFAGASAASAQSVQDRYGPARKPAPVAITAMQTASLERPAALYSGPMLNWGARRASPVIEPQPTPALAPAARQQPPAPIPTSIYESPPPPFVATKPAERSPAPLAKAAPAAASIYQSPPPAAAPVALAAAAPPRTGGTPARYYSLHRQYGLAPDAAPAQPSTPRYVLIGPPDEPDAASPSGDDDDDAPKKDRPS